MAVNVMAFSVFASALGQMAATATLTAALSGQQPSEQSLQELRDMYGANIVNQAIAMSPTKDIVDIARNVDYLVIEDMTKRYGEWATNIALQSAQPGNLAEAREIAQHMSKMGVRPMSSPYEVSAAVNEGKASYEAKAPLFGGRSRTPVKVKDLRTGIVYHSLTACGKALYPEYAQRLRDRGVFGYRNTIYYDIKKIDPNRFQEIR